MRLNKHRLGQIALFTTDSDAPQTASASPISARPMSTPASRPASKSPRRRCRTAASASASSACSAPTMPSERIQGMKDGLAGTKIELIDVRGDDIDQARAKKQCRGRAGRAAPTITCMVGFYSYNTPRIYEALTRCRQARLDHRSSASTTIRSRWAASRKAPLPPPSCSSPIEWAYQGMKLMAAYLKGDKSGVPAEQADHRADADRSTRTTSTPTGQC